MVKTIAAQIESQLTERLHVNAVEAVLGGIVLEDDDATRVRTHHDVILNDKKS